MSGRERERETDKDSRIIEQIGSIPEKFPLVRQVLSAEPISMNPSIQVYVARVSTGRGDSTML